MELELSLITITGRGVTAISPNGQDLAVGTELAHSQAIVGVWCVAID